ncbi:MAG: acetylornithine transaminase [Magnetococcales bacterium]|nr:acetylornithine transaminase [Magnetococcales bacterium]NGZ27301.1 acetylornithine transaminase [Magnetococcales bacterium]
MVEVTPSTFNALMRFTTRPDLIFVRGRGSWLWDHTGKKYLDFIQGWAVNCLGHCPPAVVEAIRRQSEELLNPSPAFYNLPAIQLADLIVQNSCVDRVFYANSGAEANEGAIKLARKWGGIHRSGAYEIITMDHGFHGRTLATMSASGKPQWENLFEPKVTGFVKVDLNDLTAVKQAITPKTVAIMLEPIQGEAGVFPAEDDYLHALRQLTHEAGLLLIFDEVQTGMGRTGTLFGYQQSGVEPDIMTLGKGMGGGLPLAALTAKEAVCCFEPGDQGGTFNGTPIITAAGLAVMKTLLEPDFLPQVRHVGDYLREKLLYLSQRFGCGEVRGKGLLLALNLGRPVGGALVTAAMENGLLLNAPRPESLRFMPALNLTTEEVDHMVAILEPLMEKAWNAV